MRKTFVTCVRRLFTMLSLLLPLAGAAGAGVQCWAQGGPPFITDDPGTPGNHHWEINFGWIANHNPGQSYYEIPDVDMNYGWGDRIQLKYELPMAVATDSNPGTSPMTSLLLALNMAATLFGLTVDECLAGATRNAARALGLAEETGALEAGKWADLAIWDIERPAELVYRLGFNPLHARVWRGR